MDYKITINYPNAMPLLPTENPEKFVGTRERNGQLEHIGVQIIESAPYIDDNVEIVDIKVITTVIAEFNPNN